MCKVKFNLMYYPDPNMLFGFMKWSSGGCSIILLGMELEFTNA